MNNNLKSMARTGFVAKGVIYAIAGILTFMAACNMGGKEAGKMQVQKFLEEQPFGNTLLVIMAIGLMAYAAWRLVESVSDPEKIGTDGKAAFKRAGYFISGILYLGVAVMAVRRVMGSSSSGSGSEQAQKSSFLASDTGLLVLGIVGGIVIIVGVVRFVKAFRKYYTKDLGLAAISNEAQMKLVKFSATAGYAARGFTYLILGFFAVRAAVKSNPAEIKTTSDAFSFLHKMQYGDLLLAAVAIGLIAHAIYMFILARHRQFKG